MDQFQIYNNLLDLSKFTEAFYFVDQKVDEVPYRIFLYRLASYTDFLQPSALESRGIMFEMSPSHLDMPVRLACRPFRKFFNLGENPMTMNLDLSEDNIEYITDKMDGSLISTYLHNDQLRLKTKGSLHSVQAVAAMELLETAEYADMRHQLKWYAKHDFTVNMEYTAPDNRIVLGYEKPGLTVLNIVDNSDGTYLVRSHMPMSFLDKHLVKDFMDEAREVGVSRWLGDVKGKTGVEGVVVCLKDGTLVKLKADAYVALHHAKDSINSPRRLFEAVVNEAADDLRSMFAQDALVIKQIGEMQEKVSALYNGMVKQVEDFYATNKALDRKSFAILGQQVLDKRFFSLVMMKYVGKEVDYKGFLIKHYKDFGIKDDPVDLEESVAA
jgi:T4 RnlA family RNA ligase